MAAADFEAVVTDVQMRELDGLQLCERITVNRPDIPVIVITAFGSLETAVQAIRAGAFDFLAKPFEVDELAFRLDRAIRHHRLSEEVKRLRGEAHAPVEGLLGESAALRALRDLVARVASADAPVLITGETGTGKELVARALHRLGTGDERALRRAQLRRGARSPCSRASSSATQRGAFTDARAAHRGLLRAGGRRDAVPRRDRGAAARAAAEAAARAPGAHACGRSAASARCPSTRAWWPPPIAISKPRSRKGASARISSTASTCCASKCRRCARAAATVLLLAQHFLREIAGRSGKPVVGISPRRRGEAPRLRLARQRPRARELRSSARWRSRSYEQILVEDLPERIRDYRRGHVLVASDDPQELVPLEEVERRYIARVMEAVGGNKTLAARILGLDRKTLYRKLERIEKIRS